MGTSNETLLTGANLFLYMGKRFGLSGSEVIDSMKNHNQSMEWFEDLPEWAQKKLMRLPAPAKPVVLDQVLHTEKKS